MKNTTTTKEDTMNEAQQRHLDHIINRGTAARAKFVAAATTARVEHLWSENDHLVTMAEGEFAQDFKDVAASKGIDIAERFLARLTEDLVEGRFEVHSSSDLSNTLGSVKREAARRWHRSLTEIAGA